MTSLANALPNIEVSSLQSGNGYLLVEESNLRIINNYKRIIHIFNLKDYEEIINKLEISIKNLQEKTDIPNSLILNFNNLKENF